MKKICYVVTISETIKAFFLPQLKWLAENGLEVTVICGYDEELEEIFENSIHYIPIRIPRGISLFGSIVATAQLIKIFKQEKFDLIQYSTPNAALYSSIAAKLVGCHIRNYHCMGFRYLGFVGIKRLLFKEIDKAICILSTHIECVSKSNLMLGIEEKLFKPEKGTVVFHGSTGGVDLKRFSIEHKEEWKDEIRKEYGIEQDDFVFGFVGRITKDKGIDELLRAYKIFALENRGKLMLVGNVEEKEDLDKQLLEWAKKNEDVLILGKKSDVEKYYAAMDVLILPSYREGFGNVVIEAQALGVPVIVSKIPGPIDAMLEHKTGICIKAKSVNELVDAMRDLSNDDRQYIYSQNARKYVEDCFDSNKINEKILERKNELLLSE